MDGLKARLSFDAVAYDYDDEYLTIDTDTHTININNVSRLFGVQYDGNSKLIKFRIRNKLSDIQKMQDSIVYINWIDSSGVEGQSIAINKTINNDTCEFAWKVPFDALKNSGVLHFAMSAVMTKNSSSVIDQRWSTQIASVITPDGIYIKSYTPSSEEEDRIAQIYNELSKMINKLNDNLQSQVNSLNEALVNKTNELKEDLVANEKEDAKTKRSLSALWDLNNGISYRFETDSEKAYKKQIPSGAKLGSVNKVGGKTIVMNQLIDPSRRDATKVEFDESTKHFKYDNWSDIGSKYICKKINIIKGHKYYIYATDKVRYVITYFYGEGMKEILSKDTDAESVIKKILIATGSGINNLYFNRYTATSEKVSYFDGCINLIDLTKMFGSGNEPSTPEEFEAMFPNDYYPYNEGELISMSVNDVIYTDTSSNQNSHPIPQSIQNIDGYGWSAGNAYNYVDFENKKYYKCVDKVDLGTLTWFASGNASNDALKVFVSNTNIESMKLTDKGRGKNFICDKFNLVDKSEIQYNAYDFVVEAKTSYYPLQFCVPKDFCTDESDFKKKVEGTTLYYELAEPIVMDISELIGDTFQEPFEVETGGSLTFKNTNGDGYRIAVPSDIQYVVALSEVNA